MGFLTHCAVISSIAIIAFLTLRRCIILGSGSTRSMYTVLFNCIMFVFFKPKNLVLFTEHNPHLYGLDLLESPT